MEIKSAATFTPDFLKGIERFRQAVGDRCSDGAVLYNGSDRFRVKGTQVFNLLSQKGYEELIWLASMYL